VNIETERYSIAIEEKKKGGPGGYESVYLTSEGDAAPKELYETLEKYQGKSLLAENQVIRQRNGETLIDTLNEEKSVGIASGFKPSGAYHFGHKLTSETVSFFQKNGAQVFVPVADIECSMDTRLTQEQYEFWAADNLLDWGANGVNLDAAHVYLQSEEFRVNTLSYIIARGLSLEQAIDTYGAEKLSSNFPFLFAGITQVGDILLPQHQDFRNRHSFMVSGQDQDGHMKMSVALTDILLRSNINTLGIETIPSGFYVPHIRGISGEKASSSKKNTTLYLGPGPEMADLDDRVKKTKEKIDSADRDNLERCSLDMVRFLECFNQDSLVSFKELCSEPQYRELRVSSSTAKTREEQTKVQFELDNYLIKRCKEQGQDNVELINYGIRKALVEHQKKREIILTYAKFRAKNRSISADKTEMFPSFWEVPNKAIVDQNKRNKTQWFDMVVRVGDQIKP
jgi:tryptophanyl-tRNA synthetase